MNSIKNEALYDGEWGVSYDPNERVMLGGYSLDGETFIPEFRITEVDSQNVADTIAICSCLYCDYGTIVSPFKNLLELYESRY